MIALSWEVLNEPGYGKLLVMHRNLCNAMYLVYTFLLQNLEANNGHLNARDKGTEMVNFDFIFLKFLLNPGFHAAI